MGVPSEEIVRVELIKISANVNMLRTKTVRGEIPGLPEVGKPIVLTSPSLSAVPKGRVGVRVVTTSPVQSIVKLGKGHYECETTHSIYLVKVLGEARVD